MKHSAQKSKFRLTAEGCSTAKPVCVLRSLLWLPVCCLQAMALPHGPGVIEVATNLIAYDWSRTEPQEAASGSPGPGTAAAHSRDSSPAASNAREASQFPAPKAGSAEDQPMCSSRLDGLTGAGPAEVAAAVAAQAQQLGLPAPGPGYVTNKTPPELIAIAAEQLQHE